MATRRSTRRPAAAMSRSIPRRPLPVSMRAKARSPSGPSATRAATACRAAPASRNNGARRPPPTACSGGWMVATGATVSRASMSPRTSALAS
eukprot:15466832-Alexandrium_andersonii.AAC.2